MEIRDRGVYKVNCPSEGLMYIGSSKKTLKQLEYNHRNWQKKNYQKSAFRWALVEHGHDWKFSWLIPPRKTNEYSILIDEGVCIRLFAPKYNSTHRYGQFPSVPRCVEGNNNYIPPQDREYL